MAISDEPRRKSGLLLFISFLCQLCVCFARFLCKINKKIGKNGLFWAKNVYFAKEFARLWNSQV